VRFIKAEANQIDIENKLIYCTDNRPPISYDVSSIDIGITPRLPYNTLRSYEGGSITPVKPIDGFCRKWDNILTRVLSTNSIDSPIRIVVVGGGAGGVELCFAIHHRLTAELKTRSESSSASLLRVSLINRGGTLMKTHNTYVIIILLLF
jgi:selenide, water dikinase